MSEARMIWSCGAPPAAPTFEASKCAWIMARALASVMGLTLMGLSRDRARDHPGRRPGPELAERALGRLAELHPNKLPLYPGMHQGVPGRDGRRAAEG